MKRIFTTIAAALMIAASACADEGMWLLPLLQQLNAGTMKELGCRLSPEQIYSVNNSSLKDAIVQFGGGCTGEIISDKGLLVTNHHCGYGSIQRLSTPEHNYLEDGYWAMDRSQELPVQGLSVTFLVSMSDITGKYGSDDELKALIEGAKADNPGCTVDAQSFYNDNVMYLMVYKIYRDVRFVGAPPASVGKFGGETDNWMWPRHTGDFSMFRVYAGKDNEPAEYSEDNVPFVPAKSLKISLKGVNEGDFTFIMGYPGRTQRFQTEAQLNHMIEIQDIAIEARTLRQNIMWKWMEKDPAIRLKYSSKYAGSSNGWKKWIGQKKAFKDLSIIEKECEKEASFNKWIDKNKKRKELFGGALETIGEVVDSTASFKKDMRLLSETLLNIELVRMPNSFADAYRRALSAGSDSTAALKAAVSSLERTYTDYYEPLDREEAAELMKYYRTKADPKNYPAGLGEDFSDMDIDAFVADLFDNSIFSSMDKLAKATGEGGIEALAADPANILLKSLLNVYMGLLSDMPDMDDKMAEASKAYTAGLLEWQKGKAQYPDANFTMRLTYGTVKPYSPKDGLLYKHYTTIYGVIEKEDPDNYEFRVPAKLKQLYLDKDYGRYAMEDGNLPCCFLTNNDITGGNSGSPVLNADGDLIGLAFDGNWESMSSDVMFEPDLQRCICVDIRYVLFLMDKLGGAGYLAKEMNFAN